MYSEHLNNVHPGWVVGGWLVSVAVTSATFMVLVGLGLTTAGTPGMGLWVAVAVAVGFLAGGLFVGFRWTDAPILHGLAMTVVTILVWLLGNLLPPRLGGGNLELGATTATLALLLVQLAAAVAGGWIGRRLVLRGEVDEVMMEG